MLSYEQFKQIKKEVTQHIKGQSAESSRLRGKIGSLAWKPGSQEAVARTRANKNPDGHRISGKSELKQYRRPETGEERNQLWQARGSIGSDTRILLLLLGMLRNRTYRQIESHEELPLYLQGTGLWLLNHELKRFWSDHKITVEQFKAWLQGGPSPLWMPPPVKLSDLGSAIPVVTIDVKKVSVLDNSREFRCLPKLSEQLKEALTEPAPSAAE